MAENNLAWIYHEGDDAWECGLCGLYFVLINDSTPKENEINFCPKCGVKIMRFIRGGRNDE